MILKQKSYFARRRRGKDYHYSTLLVCFIEFARHSASQEARGPLRAPLDRGPPGPQTERLRFV